MAQSRSFILRIAATALCLLAAMTVFESAKQFLFPHISIWQSHVVTIVFTATVGTLLSYLVFRRIDALSVELELRVATRTAELEASNRQLSSFSYTVAHDLRTPLRAINGFGALILRDKQGVLDEVSTGRLKRIVANGERMGALIDYLLDLARFSRQEPRREIFNLSELAADIVATLTAVHPQRKVAVRIEPGLQANGDLILIRVVLENLIGNAWKFTADTAAASIEIGSQLAEGQIAYYVRDNGAGFNMDYAHKLFAPFQRLHHADQFEGTGIGLATARSIIQRHGGEVWVESAVDAGTTALFTLGNPA